MNKGQNQPLHFRLRNNFQILELNGKQVGPKMTKHRIKIRATMNKSRVMKMLPQKIVVIISDFGYPLFINIIMLSLNLICQQFIQIYMNKEDTKNGNKSEKKQVIKVKADFSYLTSFNYKITKEIGRGGYGVVYKAHQLNNEDHLCAIKINFNTVSRQLIFAEMAFLMIVRQKPRLPNLVNLFVYHDISHIVLEYFKYKPFITFFNTMGIEDIKHYIYELLLGLKELKNMGIYHRDIKPGNFLYNPDTKRGTIIDFGLAEIDQKFKEKLEKKLAEIKSKNLPGRQKIEKDVRLYKKLTECLKIIGRNKIGTQTYMPLQSILHHQEQSYQSDMWPVGVIMLQFVLRKYNVFNSVRVLNKPSGIKNTYYITYLIQLATFFGSQAIIKECKNFSFDVKLPSDIEKLTFRQVSCLEGFDDQMQDLLNKLLTLNPNKRITVEQALNHSFFDEIREEHQEY